MNENKQLDKETLVMAISGAAIAWRGNQDKFLEVAIEMLDRHVAEELFLSTKRERKRIERVLRDYFKGLVVISSPQKTLKGIVESINEGKE